MTAQRNNPEQDQPAGVVNPGYAVMQLAKALTTSAEHRDSETRERAQARIAKWESVLLNVLNGSVAYGSRTPLEGVPTWVTLEVVTGGFATGRLLAGGPLQPHEQQLLESLPQLHSGEERRALNAHFLTDEGLAKLQQLLRTGCYDIDVPEEGALLVVAWLVENGYGEQARSLLDEISSHFSDLRFYPIPLEEPRRFGSRVHVQDVRQTIGDLNRIKPNTSVLAQKEAVEVWAPFLDRIVGLFSETVQEGWPCRTFPEGWAQRAFALEAEYTVLRKKHSLCGKPVRARGHFAQLRQFLSQCARRPQSLTGREVGRIRLILNRYLAKRGRPDSSQCIEKRRRQQADVSGPLFHTLGQIVVSRLQTHVPNEGVDDIIGLTSSVSTEESTVANVPVGSSIPDSIQRKVERCLNETVAVLVERGLITSGESLARVLPQMTSGLRAAGISDPVLRRLYSAIYRAFRRRRSLLLLNLEKQVQIEELPWIGAIDQFRQASLSGRELARQTLEEVIVLTVTSFPHAILPNKLLQELRALAKTADLDIPLVDEVAADIFMGEFSGKFVESAKRAAELLDGTLYATYYGIDFDAVRRMPSLQEDTRRDWWGRSATSNHFAELCASRAGVPLGTWDPATNGMIIEQQQILTTQNLAALFSALDVSKAVREQLSDMALRCLRWIFRRLQIETDNWHARLIGVKNAAYAWRQMLFFLALLPKPEVSSFLELATEEMNLQSEAFSQRFRPAIEGLRMAINGESPDVAAARRRDARSFLGWSKERHWLLAKSE
jgi:hypothetical protein